MFFCVSEDKKEQTPRLERLLTLIDGTIIDNEYFLLNLLTLFDDTILSRSEFDVKYPFFPV